MSSLLTFFFGKCKGNKILNKMSSESWPVKLTSVLKALVSVLQSKTMVWYNMAFCRILFDQPYG